MLKQRSSIYNVTFLVHCCYWYRNMDITAAAHIKALIAEADKRHNFLLPFDSLNLS